MTTPQPHRLHQFTPQGIRSAKDYLAAIRNDFRIPLPDSMLTAPPYATPIEPPVYVERRTFATRRDAGIYLTRRLAPLDAAKVLGNAYLWSWLGMFYFEDIANKDINGNISLGRSPDAAYVIDPENRVYSDELQRIRLAYEIYTLHGCDAWYMLDEPVNSLSHFTARLVNKKEAFRSHGIIKLAHLLYADVKMRRLKRGIHAHSRTDAAFAGSLWHLMDILDQLYMTYDIYGMDAEQILPLLPPEFDRFKPA